MHFISFPFVGWRVVVRGGREHPDGTRFRRSSGAPGVRAEGVTGDDHVPECGHFDERRAEDLLVVARVVVEDHVVAASDGVMPDAVTLLAGAPHARTNRVLAHE